MFKGFRSKASDVTRKAQRKVGSTPTPDFLNDRHGADQFNRFLVIAALVMFVLAFLPKLHFLTWIGLAALAYSFFRMFSRNAARRMAENRAYLRLAQKVKSRFGRKQSAPTARSVANDDVRMLICPECGQKIRVPKVSGTIRIICPKCKHEMYRKS